MVRTAAPLTVLKYQVMMSLPRIKRESVKESTMAVTQGDPGLLDDPSAQELLHATIPARLAYTWPDGTPRVVPIWLSGSTGPARRW
jgi:hypothetical protein